MAVNFAHQPRRLPAPPAPAVVVAGPVQVTTALDQARAAGRNPAAVVLATSEEEGGALLVSRQVW